MNAMGEESVKIIIAIVGCLFASGLMAETAHFSTFGITIEVILVDEMDDLGRDHDLAPAALHLSEHSKQRLL